MPQPPTDPPTTTEPPPTMPPMPDQLADTITHDGEYLHVLQTRGVVFDPAQALASAQVICHRLTITQSKPFVVFWSMRYDPSFAGWTLHDIEWVVDLDQSYYCPEAGR